MDPTTTLNEIIALPPRYVLQITAPDPHPPPLIRLMLSCEWCRQLWGRGVWDEWDREWRGFYPTHLAPPEAREMLTACVRYLPLVAKVFLRARFRVLGNRTISALFDMDQIDPSALAQVAAQFPERLSELRTPAQLAVFRLLKEQERFDEEQLDQRMTKWLLGLARTSDVKQKD